MKTESRLFGSYTDADGPTETQAESAVRYRRQVDTEQNDVAQVETARKRNVGYHREIHFAFLPERYESLVEEDIERAEEETKKKKKEAYKKVRKNIGKALRCGWKCLILGLHSFTAAYSTPITAATKLVPEFLAGRT